MQLTLALRKLQYNYSAKLAWHAESAKEIEFIGTAIGYR